PSKRRQYEHVYKHIGNDILDIKVDYRSFTISQLMNYPTCFDINNYEFYYKDAPFLDANNIIDNFLDSEAVNVSNKLTVGRNKKSSSKVYESRNDAYKQAREINMAD